MEIMQGLSRSLVFLRKAACEGDWWKAGKQAESAETRWESLVCPCQRPRALLGHCGFEQRLSDQNCVL